MGSVNLWNGNFFLCQAVVSLPGDGFPLQFNLYFNGESTADGPFGLKWRNTYQMRLNVNLTDRVGLESANGTLYYYYPRGSGYIAAPGAPGAPGDLMRNPDGTYQIVTYDDHVVYRFDKDGAWTQKFDPVTGATQTIAYQDGNVIVTDGFGRSLTIETKGTVPAP